MVHHSPAWSRKVPGLCIYHPLTIHLCRSQCQTRSTWWTLTCGATGGQWTTTCPASTPTTSRKYSTHDEVHPKFAVCHNTSSVRRPLPLTAGLSLCHGSSMVSISGDLFNLINSGMILSWCSASSTLRAGPSISSPPGQNGMYVDMLGLKSRSTSYDEYNKNPNDLYE